MSFTTTQRPPKARHHSQPVWFEMITLDRTCAAHVLYFAAAGRSPVWYRARRLVAASRAQHNLPGTMGKRGLAAAAWSSDTSALPRIWRSSADDGSSPKGAQLVVQPAVLPETTCEHRGPTFSTCTEKERLASTPASLIQRRIRTSKHRLQRRLELLVELPLTWKHRSHRYVEGFPRARSCPKAADQALLDPRP
eukprot:TRINITY_DN9754_c1_g3_i1.p1 TRINITY_DN9754_c1_g3~~TRINITY_DN9754_c1_g3_i1.p1  ORF type:complete len:194 (+),score=7.56 TRINITY_DN9754_c1_g3_i1:118-699(+)